MNKILISIDKEYMSFSKYNRSINEQNLNNTNVIDINSFKFTEEYILENLELVAAFINFVILKFDISKIKIKHLEIAETVLKIVKNLNNIKYINFTEDKGLNYTISSMLFLENKNIDKIECYSLPNIMFYKFDKNQIQTRSKILSTSEFLNYNSINTYSDLFNKEKIIIGEYLTKDDIPALTYFLDNNKNIKKIEFKKYSKKNLDAIIYFINKNNLKNINIIIYETSETTNQLLEDSKKFDKLNKKYKIKIKIKYSKEYKEKNRIKELNLTILKYIILLCIFIGIISFISYKLLEKNNNKAIEDNMNKINNKVEQNISSQEKNPQTENLNENKEEYISSYYKEYSKAYNELLKINSDTVGWLTINNTKINYPVVQSKDNDYYLNHAYDKTKNIAGWLFVDYRNDMNNINKNTIIYGHSGLKGNIMFSSLQNVLNKIWYNNQNNLQIKFSIKEKEYIWQIFSIYIIDVTNDYLYTEFNSDNEYINFINKIKERSIKNFGIEITPNDKILTLSTCYKSDKKRIVVHAKLVQ